VDLDYGPGTAMARQCTNESGHVGAGMSEISARTVAQKSRRLNQKNVGRYGLRTDAARRNIGSLDFSYGYVVVSRDFVRPCADPEMY